jgi:hypothetical protein
MRIRIRDWNLHFEQDRSKQWKNIKWVPIPNKQGKGYRKIMSEKNGLEIFACWIALVQQGSLCNPRGDLTKYDLSDLSLLTLIDTKFLTTAINYLSQTLDWIEVIQENDKNVNECQKNVLPNTPDSSILCNSIQSNSLNSSWRTDYQLYIDGCNKSFDELKKNTVWLEERKTFHRGLDLILSLEKMRLDFWATKAGWKNKKDAAKGKPDYVIDWPATVVKGLNLKSNQVWLPKSEQPQGKTNLEKAIENMQAQGIIPKCS